jgi:hypothetical protein
MRAPVVCFLFFFVPSCAFVFGLFCFWSVLFLLLARQRNYPPGSEERRGIEEAVKKMLAEAPFDVPCVVDGKEVGTGGRWGPFLSCLCD